MNLHSEIANAEHLAVITGAAGGLGNVLARDLSAEGWATILVDRQNPSPEITAGFKTATAYLQGDVTDESFFKDIAAAVTASRSSFAVIAAAGVISVGKTEDLPLSEWEHVLRVNLTGTFLTLRSFVDAARKAQTGRLIAIASDAAKTGEAWISHYCASKFGVVGLVESLALELVSEGITVNAICPSILDTPMMQQLAEDFATASGEGTAEYWREQFVAEIPAGRACQPRDISNAMQFLLSEKSDFITGQALNVAGGHETH